MWSEGGDDREDACGMHRTALLVEGSEETPAKVVSAIVASVILQLANELLVTPLSAPLPEVRRRPLPKLLQHPPAE